MAIKPKIKYCGLLGGSFNPPHLAHVKISEFCEKFALLDDIWWILSANPFKDPSSALSTRYTRIKKILRDTNCQAVSKVHTYDTLCHSVDIIEHLQAEYTNRRFCFIMGADSFLHLHRWKDWRRFCELLPILVVSRPGFNDRLKNSVAALTIPGIIYDNASSLEHKPGFNDRENNEIFTKLFSVKPPVWIFLQGLQENMSSSSLRSL